MEEMEKVLMDAVKTGDNEKIHSVYDKMIEQIALQHEPDLVKALKILVKDVDFWCA